MELEKSQNILVNWKFAQQYIFYFIFGEYYIMLMKKVDPVYTHILLIKKSSFCNAKQQR